MKPFPYKREITYLNGGLFGVVIIMVVDGISWLLGLDMCLYSDLSPSEFFTWYLRILLASLNVIC